VLKKALFSGLIIDELDQLVQDTFVGETCFYVLDDAGFKRHIESEYVDRQILGSLQGMIAGNEELITDGTMKMLGQDDIFTRAVIERSLKDTESQVEELFRQGLPDDARTYLGMMGFRVVINYHGEVLEIRQPSAKDPEE